METLPNNGTHPSQAYIPKRSLPMRRRTAVHGRSVFSKQRHHSRGVIVLSRSKSHVSKNGLMQRSFWSCSKSYISCVDKKPSLFKSKWPYIHLASFLQAAGKRAEKWQKENVQFISYFSVVATAKTTKPSRRQWPYVFHELRATQGYKTSHRTNISTSYAIRNPQKPTIDE